MRAAVVGGTVWAVPTLISAGPAGAVTLNSPPPDTTTPNTTPPTNPPPTNPPGGGGTTTPATTPGSTTPGSTTPGSTTPGDGGTGGETETPGDGGVGGIGEGQLPSGLTELPRTGTSLDGLAATGMTSIVAGSALVYWSAQRALNPAPVAQPPAEPAD